METRDYGLWDSPISSEMLTTSGSKYGFTQYDGDTLYWTEQRPQDKGRTALCRLNDGVTEDVVSGDYNVRSLVHEYGGIAYAVRHSRVVFINFEDQCLYEADGAGTRQITESGTKFAEPVFVSDGDTVVAVAEVEQQPEARNFLALVSLETGAVSVLDEGADFYASPAVTEDGKRIAWLTWNHPNMPWSGSDLWVADLDERGITNRQRVGGGLEESIFQPQWTQSGELLFSSDQSGWWNLMLWDGHDTRPIHETSAEFGLPQWFFGMSTSAVCGDYIAAAYTSDGIWRLGLLDQKTGHFTDQDLPFTSISQVRSNGSEVSFIAASPEHPSSLVRFNPQTGTWELLKASVSINLPLDCISVGEPIAFSSGSNTTAHAFYYPPKNGNFVGPPDRLPPLIVMSHGGPTAAVGNGLSVEKLYWTSRGFAVVVVNYRGSTGFGREYTMSLNGMWGIYDIEDCCAAARHLVRKNMADPDRLAVRGGSAGGYTTLGCLAFENLFNVGASYFGIGELTSLARDTHKFESRYLDALVGPWPEAKNIYEERSPLLHVENLSCPVIFFQGLEDKIVPPNQAETMVAALRNRGVDVEYVAYPDEQHGFRMAQTIIDSIEKELAFYLKTWNMA